MNVQTWNDVIIAVIGMFGTIGAAVAPLLLVLLYRWIAKKMQLEADAHVEAQLATVATEAVHYAEQWGRKSAKLNSVKVTPGHEKLEEAVAFAAHEISRRKLPAIAADQLARLIEAKLGQVNAAVPASAPEPPK